jgi:hypothetical protein
VAPSGLRVLSVKRWGDKDFVNGGLCDSFILELVWFLFYMGSA